MLVSGYLINLQSLAAGPIYDSTYYDSTTTDADNDVSIYLYQMYQLYIMYRYMYIHIYDILIYVIYVLKHIRQIYIHTYLGNHLG